MERLMKMIIAAILAAAVFGCQKTEPQDLPVKATVSIEKVSNSSPSECTMRFVPTEDAVSFYYAIGESGDFESFRNGTMPEMVKVEGNEPLEVTFTDLDSRHIYTVFAKADDANGTDGTVYMYRVMTADAFYMVEPYYIMDESAGFKISFTNDYYDSEYYLGKPGERDAFMSGSVETERLGDVSVQWFIVNFFDLEPSTDYVLYVKGYNRAGQYEYRELAVTTKGAEETPKVTLESEINIYKGSYTLTGNSLTGKITAFILDLGAYDHVIFNELGFAGDIITVANNWSETAFNGAVSSTDGVLKIEHITPELMLDRQMEMYVVVTDKDMNPVGVQHFTFSTPSKNSSAPKCTVDVKVSDITSKGATYTYTADENTFAFMYDTVDAAWYDQLKESPEWSEFYLHNTLFTAGQYWAYRPDTENGVREFIEATGTPNTRYYAAACPMNENGPNGDGWQKEVLVEYTTLAE